MKLTLNAHDPKEAELPVLCGITATRDLRGGYRWKRGMFEATAAESTVPADRKQKWWVCSWHIGDYGVTRKTRGGLEGSLDMIRYTLREERQEVAERLNVIEALLEVK